MKKMLMALVVALPLLARTMDRAPEVSVLVDGEPRPEYVHHGTTYIEALRGRDFTIRLRNPTPDRVAVALSVDGLNTIDAKHTDAWNAAKWVLEPNETAEISGWQVSERTARRFYFTGERDSYGARLGQTRNLGIIEAVFYRERIRHYSQELSRKHRDEGRSRPAPSATAPHSGAESQAAPSDDYAATGMGRGTDHAVQEVEIALEREPIAVVALRYEFRPQLLKLGVADRDPLERRESARGFCPER